MTRAPRQACVIRFIAHHASLNAERTRRSQMGRGTGVREGVGPNPDGNLNRNINRMLTNYQRNKTASFHRILDFDAENPLATPIAVPALITELTTTTATIDTLAADKDLAFGTVHGAVVDKRELKKDLLSFLKDLAETARVLDPVAYPGLAAEMRLYRAASSYSALIIRARAFYDALVPAKQAFVDYGSAATVDADLLAMITALEAAMARKNGGRAIHIGGNAGIRALCKAGTAIVRKLDAILSKVYKNDPVKYAAWKAARHVQRPAQASATEPAPAPALAQEGEGGSSGSGT